MVCALLSGARANLPGRDCGWRETEPAQFANKRALVEWGSDADRAGSERNSAYNFSRFVANGGREPLLVHWDVGRMLIAALAPEHTATLCEHLPMNPYMIYGPISVQSGAGPVHTTVWEAGSDWRDLGRVAGRPLESVFTLGTGDADSAGAVSIRLVTELQPDQRAGDFRARYRIENLATAPIEVSWPVVPQMIRELRFPRPLGPRGRGSDIASWETQAGLPVFVHVPVIVSSPHSGVLVARVGIPTFIVREGPS